MRENQFFLETENSLESVRAELIANIVNLGTVEKRGILDVTSFLNHQVYPAFLRRCAFGLNDLLRSNQTIPTKVLTAEASGNALAVEFGLVLASEHKTNIPVISAKKKISDTMREDPYKATAPSHTQGGEVSLVVDRRYLRPKEQVVIIDDFLANGKTAEALADIADQAGAEVVGVGVAIEKLSEGGRERLRKVIDPPVPIAALVTISEMTLALKGKPQEIIFTSIDPLTDEILPT